MYLTHGLSRSPEYQVWHSMKKRCHDQKNGRYRDYGGRGIYVCEEWRNSFANFFADMGPRPDGMTLDRLNNDGPYCVDNCRWATDEEQRANKRQPKRYANNRTGIRGVSLLCTGRYLIQISAKGKQHYIGYKTDFFEACCLAKAAENKLKLNQGI